MMIQGIIVALVFSGRLPYPLVTELDDTRVTVDGVRLSNPTDALFVGGVLYVAEGNDHTILMLAPDGTLSRFGRAGRAPGEFQHMPSHLRLEGDDLVVAEWNYHYTSRFSLDGQFSSRKKRGASWGDAATLGLRRLSWEEVQDSGFMLYDERGECFFSQPERDVAHPEYLAIAILREDREGRLYAVKRVGVVEVYERPCQVLYRMPVPVVRFAAEVKPHRIMAAIKRAARPNDKWPSLVHGRPVMDAAVDGPDRVWLLVKNEHPETGPEYQTVADANTWLFEVDPMRSRVTYSLELDRPVNRIRFTNGNLLLISAYEATVQVYRVRT